jgi:CrcB protein
MERLLEIGNAKGFFLVGLGGCLGCMVRWYFARIFTPGTGGLPKGTLLANSLAALVLGASAGFLERSQGQGSASWYLFAGVGFAGGLSTFSTFAIELLQLVGRGSPVGAAVFLFLNVGASLLLVLAGKTISTIWSSGV